MKFSEMPYQRITLEELRADYDALTQQLGCAKTYEDFLALQESCYRLNDRMTPMTIASIRHDMDLNDTFYAAEQAYYDEIGPELRDIGNNFDKALLASPMQPFLREYIGEQAYEITEIGQQSFDSRLIPLMKEQSELSERYNVLVTNAEVEWEGESIPREQLSQPMQSPDRAVRKEAKLLSGKSWMEQSEELEEIFDKLVKNRDAQAKMLGYDNYSQLSYRRMYRIGYGAEEVASFIAQAKRYLVPVWKRQYERKRQRLGLEKLYIYDGIDFPQGDPVPLGDTEWSLARTREMYEKLSPETAEFAKVLFENELFDVEQRRGKRGGGYQDTLGQYRLPFIFANFDGTSENAYIMCHEGGHAFQCWLKSSEPVREQCWLTSEVAETHAMAMELFTLPYMDLFFGERAGDYCQSILEGAIRRILFQCEQDEFQQEVYTHPDMSKEERNALWLRLEEEYFPGYTERCGENTFFATGRGWQQIRHVFHWPFYAIDYGLSEVCALGFYAMAQHDPEQAWKRYLQFCKDSGKKSFPQLVEDAGIGDPFAPETMESIAKAFD